MAISTYAELKAAIADFLNRDDLTSAIPNFVSLAEANLKRDVRHWRMENRATATLDSQYEALPARWVAPIRLMITGSPSYELEPVGQAEMANLRASNNGSGRPQYYALTQGELEFYPTPDAEYTLEMVYYEAPAAFSSDGDTNWLLQNFPDAYLYGSLIHTAPYLSDDARTQVWAALYQAAVDKISADNQTAKYGGAGLRVKIRSY